jgi:hypothetical protein
VEINLRLLIPRVNNQWRREGKMSVGKNSQNAEEEFLAKCEAIVFTSEGDFERCRSKADP